MLLLLILMYSIVLSLVDRLLYYFVYVYILLCNYIVFERVPLRVDRKERKTVACRFRRLTLSSKMAFVSFVLSSSNVIFAARNMSNELSL